MISVPTGRASLRSARGAVFQREGIRIVDKDRVKGTVKQVKGTVKAQVGKLTGNESLEVEGTVERVEGAVQKAFGKVKDALRGR